MIRKFGISILLLASVLSQLTRANEERSNMSNENDVINTVKTMTKAFNARDIEGVLAAYESDASVMFEPGKKSTGKGALKNAFLEFFAVNPEFSYPNGHEAFVSGDLGLHIAPWKMMGTAPDGSTIEQSGLSIAVLRKQENGQWLLTIDNPHGQFLLSH